MPEFHGKWLELKGFERNGARRGEHVLKRTPSVYASNYGFFFCFPHPWFSLHVYHILGQSGDSKKSQVISGLPEGPET